MSVTTKIESFETKKKELLLQLLPLIPILTKITRKFFVREFNSFTASWTRFNQPFTNLFL
jgi:hypothetical protein